MRYLLIAAASAAAATFVKSKAEEIQQPQAEKLLPPKPAQRVELGADPSGHPENMPPSELADRAVHAVTGGELSDSQRQQVQDPIHWATGIGAGVAYALLARRWPAARTGFGTLAGLGLFAATHGSSLPAAGLQHPPTKMPAAWWIWEGGSHVIYGAALDAGLRLADVLDR